MTVREQNSDGIEQWLSLIRADGVGPTTFGKLLNHFGSVDGALGASVGELTKVEGIGFKTAEQIARTRGKFDATEELALAEKLGVWMIHLEDARYPVLLRQIYDPPPVLYIKGTLGREDNLALAIVGSRRCSLYGQEQASRLGHGAWDRHGSASGGAICWRSDDSGAGLRAIEYISAGELETV